MIQLYTDASTMSNTGLAGIAWKVIYEDDSAQISARHIGKSDSNRAELVAIIEALKLIDPVNDIALYTDSRYCLNLITAKNLHTDKYEAGAKSYKHKKLIGELRQLVDKFHSFNKYYVQAHATDKHNIEVDKYAKMAAKEVNLLFNMNVPISIGKYNYNRTELEELTNMYLNTLTDDRLAAILSQIYCAKFTYNQATKKYNGSVDLIKS